MTDTATHPRVTHTLASLGHTDADDDDDDNFRGVKMMMMLVSVSGSLDALVT